MTFGKAHTINLKNEFTEEQLGNSMSTRHEFLNGKYKVFWKRGNPATFQAKAGDRFLVITGDGFPKIIKMQPPLATLYGQCFGSTTSSAETKNVSQARKSLRSTLSRQSTIKGTAEVMVAIYQTISCLRPTI